jgi:hypothetical protein
MRKIQTVKDLAELFGKHKNTVYKWIVEDRLFPNAFKVKDGWYIPENDITRLLRAGRTHAADLRTDAPPSTGVRPPSASPQSSPARPDPTGHRAR